MNRLQSGSTQENVQLQKDVAAGSISAVPNAAISTAEFTGKLLSVGSTDDRINNLVFRSELSSNAQGMRDSVDSFSGAVTGGGDPNSTGGQVGQVGVEGAIAFAGSINQLNRTASTVDDLAESSADIISSGGRKGNAATRAQNQAIADAAEAAGEGTHTAGASLPERYYPNPAGGRAGGRYSDVEITRTDGTKRVANTVDTTKNGIPTDREMEAALDIYERLDEGDTLELISK